MLNKKKKRDEPLVLFNRCGKSVNQAINELISIPIILAFFILNFPMPTITKIIIELN